MSKRLFFLISVITIFCGAASGYEGQDAFGEYYITVGEPNIDGVIDEGEWDDAKWLPLDLCYSDMQGVPCPDDLSDANWAALWSPENNRIYVVVTGRDTDHVFGDCYCNGTDYNKYDLVEVYVDANNSDWYPYQLVWNDEGQEMGQDYAQQWMTGNDNNDGWWCVPPQWPDYNDDIPLTAEYIPDMATTVVDDVLTYEYALTPYESFGWLSGRETKELQLEADLQVGLDIVIGSKDGSFGTLCENAYDGNSLGPDGIEGTADDGVLSMGKWDDASVFLDHWLVLDVNQSWRPRPAYKAVEQPREVTLVWNAGRNAAWHHIYFGSDLEDVNDADDPNAEPIGKGRQELAKRSYKPEEEFPLKLGQTYYWRVDEVNGSTIWRGNIWRFKVREFLLVDDFDGYEETKDLRTVWKDGWTNEDSGAEVTLEEDSYYTRDGNSAEVSYTNGSLDGWYYSEIEAETSKFDVGTNWQQFGMKALALWFHGKVDNDIQPMYVSLEDGESNVATVLYDNPNDLKYAYWKEWNIDLQDFVDDDANLKNITKISIGIGDKEDTELELAEGNVWFEDIRLYTPRCVPAEARADFTGDCVTDMAELEIMAGDWQDSEFWVDVTDPNEGTGNLLLWYEFDETSGFDAIDSSGNGYTGDVEEDTWAEGYIGGALDFKDIESAVEVPVEAFSAVTTQITIACWIYGDEYMQPQADNLFEGTREYSNNEIRVINSHVPYSDGIVNWGAGNPNEIYDLNSWQECERIEKMAKPDEYKGKWNHWTFVKNMDANSQGGVMKMYLNGLLWHIGYDYNELPTRTMDRFRIGKGYDGSYAGRIDDFRVYDYELSQEEIAWLATKGTGYYPLQSRTANIYLYLGKEDEIIDFKDFAVMADYWLEEVLFPSP